MVRPWTLVVIAVGCVFPCAAATYYVDFDSGNNSNTGTSTSSPWKHSPGDPAVSGVPASRTLAPGDVVRFKGGTVYRGGVSLIGSGSDSQPITYDGNADGTWGTGKAIFDGSDPVSTSWTPCASAADCGGNANWANIYYTTVPAGVQNGWPQLLYNGTNQTHTAQHPNPSNRFLFDVITEWTSMAPSQVSSTSIKDSAYFTQSSASDWNEAWIGVWVTGNATIFNPITSFNPSTGTVSFTSLSNPPYTDRDSYYSVFNHPALIDQPGEHAVNIAANRLYLWPPGSVPPNNYAWSIARRANAFWGVAKNNVTIRNFLIRGYFSTVGAAGYSGTALSLAPNTYTGTEGRNNVFQDNEVIYIKNMDREWLITMNNGNGTATIGNKVTYCFGGGVYCGGTNVVVSSNTFSYLSGTAIYMPGARNSSISHNVVHNILGTHANGISIYSGADTVEVSYNHIRNCPSLLTYERSANLSFIGNLVDAAGKDQRINDWGGMTGYVRYYGNTIVGNSDDRILNSTSGTGAAFDLRNNIIDGGGNGSTAETRGHNIYVGLHYWQAQSYGWSLRTGESISTEAALFVNPAAGDYRLKADSAAIDAGTDLSSVITSDMAGQPRPQGARFDIGTYEYNNSAGRPAPPRNARATTN